MSHVPSPHFGCISFNLSAPSPTASPDALQCPGSPRPAPRPGQKGVWEAASQPALWNPLQDSHSLQFLLATDYPLLLFAPSFPGSKFHVATHWAKDSCLCHLLWWPFLTRFSGLASDWTFAPQSLYTFRAEMLWSFCWTPGAWYSLSKQAFLLAEKDYEGNRCYWWPTCIPQVLHFRELGLTSKCNTGISLPGGLWQPPNNAWLESCINIELPSCSGGENLSH